MALAMLMLGGCATDAKKTTGPSPLQKIALSEEHFFMAPFDGYRALVSGFTAVQLTLPGGTTVGLGNWKNVSVPVTKGLAK